MKVFASILAIAAIASAAATPNMKRQTASSLCGPLDTPQCCGTDVLGVADLSCSAVPNTVTTTADFTTYCAAKSETARCCVVSLLGSTGLVCSGVA
ncbi:hypothetical protein E4T52_05267 [Aureobasidium sp. EXF-3400]|nr:hypothetical protein E4T51_04504 [Aureobasidium sp. EXF-12344]KAI4779791.1 hypothetical protein E4T52_05267 [Aureobasidium sp. EXF-3400]